MIGIGIILLVLVIVEYTLSPRVDTARDGKVCCGTVKSFGILKDKMVHVTSYKEGSNVKYITTPTKGFNLIS